jgi:hypothetical protein
VSRDAARRAPRGLTRYFFRGWTETVAVDEAPRVSVTRSLTVTRPGFVYVNVGATAVESPNAPSPFRSQE